MVNTGSDENPEKADRVEVDKDRQTVKLFDKSNTLIGFYPATVGSEEKPSPSGTLKVTEIDRNPTYHYNPAYHFQGVHSRKPFTIRPGPNNPVGTVWINLSGDGYGIHGTPSPGKVSKSESTAASGSRIGMPSASPSGCPKALRSHLSMIEKARLQVHPSGRALRAGVADRVQHFGDRDGGRLR